MSTIIELQHVNHWYRKGEQNEIQALKDINLKIEQGDYVAFFGPSGCGKTTLLYATSGIDRVNDGKILVKGQDIAKFTNLELAIFRQTGIGIVFQQFNLVPSLTVLQNVALPLAFVGVTKLKAEVEAMKLVERLQLQAYADHYPGELSGGQQQRVGIARALANNPPIIIADEPVGNLDSINAHNVLEILKDLNEKDGRTIIMVTHEAWSLQDVHTVYHMKDGEITSVEKRELVGAGKGAGAGAGSPEDVKKEFIKKQLAREAGKNEAMHLMARILSNSFMRGHTQQENERFETLLLERIAGKIDTSRFIMLLGSRYEDGGVGLWKKRADSISHYVDSLLQERQSLDQVIERLNQNPSLPIAEEVRKLRTLMAQEYVGTLSPYRIEVIEELIGDRIKSNIDAAQFLAFLHAPVKQGGAGVPAHTAQKMAERLEVVVGGSEIFDPNI